MKKLRGDIACESRDKLALAQPSPTQYDYDRRIFSGLMRRNSTVDVKGKLSSSEQRFQWHPRPQFGSDLER